MTINYTTLLGLAEPVTGTQSGTWGDDVNRGITDYLDVAIAGTQTVSGSQTAVTLSLTNGDNTGNNISQVGSGSTGTAQFAVINCTGNPAGLLTITVPASSRQYIVVNATSTSQSVKIVGAGPTTGVTLVSGEKAIVAWNGSDFIKVSSTVITNQTGTLTTDNGGTGLASFTAGDLPYYATGTALSKLGIGSANTVLTSSGTAPQWSSTSGISVGTATNLAGGATGSLPYQSTAGATTFLAAGTNGQILTLAGGVPTWAANTGISTGKSIAMAMIFGG